MTKMTKNSMILIRPSVSVVYTCIFTSGYGRLDSISKNRPYLDVYMYRQVRAGKIHSMFLTILVQRGVG